MPEVSGLGTVNIPATDGTADVEAYVQVDRIGRIVGADRLRSALMKSPLTGQPNINVAAGNVNEVVNGGDGSTAAFSGTVVGAAAAPHSFKLIATRANDTTMTVVDDGAGNLAGDGSGTINYASGAYSVTFTSAPKNGSDVLASYASSWVEAGPGQGETWSIEQVELYAVGSTYAINGLLCGSGASDGTGYAVCVGGIWHATRQGDSDVAPFYGGKNFEIAGGLGGEFGVVINSDAGHSVVCTVPVRATLVYGQKVVVAWNFDAGSKGGILAFAKYRPV